MKCHRFARGIGTIVLSIPILVGCNYSASSGHPSSQPQVGENKPTSWLQLTSPKALQILKSGPLLISGELSGKQAPYLHVTLIQSSNYNYQKYGTILTQGNVQVQSGGVLNGSLTVPEFSRSKGNLFFLVIMLPAGELVVPLH